MKRLDRTSFKISNLARKSFKPPSRQSVSTKKNKFSVKNLSVEGSRFPEHFRMEIFLRQSNKRYDAIRFSKPFLIKNIGYKTLKLKIAMLEKTNQNFGYSRKERQVKFQEFALMKLKWSAFQKEKHFFLVILNSIMKKLDGTPFKISNLARKLLKPPSR